MKIREVLSPTAGLFSAMNQEIWGGVLDPEHMDIELWTRIGELDAAPLMRYFVSGTPPILNASGLANLLYSRYQRNWKRIWLAVIETEYDLYFTDGTTEKRKITRDSTDTETRDLNNSLTDSGMEKLTDTFNESNDVTDVLTKLGSEKHTVGDIEERKLEMTKKGTVKDEGTDKTTGTRDVATDRGVYGVGGVGLTNESRDVVTESPNITDTEDKTQTLNLIDGDTGTVKKTTNDSLTFDLRKDATERKDAHKGINEHKTDFGKKVDGKEDGTIKSVLRDVTTDEFEAKRSSLLQTTQMLIQQELDGRHGQIWNFTDLVISDVQEMIASLVWKRDNVAL